MNLIEQKRKMIWYRWDQLRDIVTEDISFPPREYLESECRIKDISSELPADIELVDRRRGGCMELFQDFESLYQTDGEPIPFGRVWYVVFYDESGEIHDVSDACVGFDEAIEYAVEHAQAYDMPILRYTSIYDFDNAYYRHMEK